MRERLHARLDELRGEFERGRSRLVAIDEEQEQLRAKMLRISGAIQVLEEELADGGGDDDAGGARAGDASP